MAAVDEKWEETIRPASRFGRMQGTIGSVEKTQDPPPQVSPISGSPNLRWPFVALLAASAVAGLGCDRFCVPPAQPQHKSDARALCKRAAFRAGDGGGRRGS